MKICENGIVRDMTPDEIAAMEAHQPDTPAHEPTIEERVSSVEETTDALLINLLFRQI